MMVNTPPMRPRRNPVPLNNVMAAPAPTPPGLAIVSVVRNGSSSYAVTFSASPVVNTGVTPNGGFTANGLTPTSIYPMSGNQVTLNFASTGAGLPWTVSAQPNWLTSAITIPQSGATS